MGRRKKEIPFSYADIIVSTYVRHSDYKKAQLRYSNSLEKVRTSQIDESMLVEFNIADLDEDDLD